MFTFELSNEFTPLLGVHNGVHKGVQIGVQIGGPDWGSRFCGYPFYSVVLILFIRIILFDSTIENKGTFPISFDH